VPAAAWASTSPWPPWPLATVATGRDPEKVATAIGAHEDLFTVALDITDPAAATTAVQAAVDRFGNIDVLVNNAGNFYAGFFVTLSARKHSSSAAGGESASSVMPVAEGNVRVTPLARFFDLPLVFEPPRDSWAPGPHRAGDPIDQEEVDGDAMGPQCPVHLRLDLEAPERGRLTHTKEPSYTA
jgi:short chain dehydrogenase